MKNGTGQLTLILLLMFALFLQIEGVVPDIFASNEEPLLMISEKDGLEFKAIIDEKSFSENKELMIRASIKNISAEPIDYYAGTASYGIRGALGAALYSFDGKSEFTDELTLKNAGKSTDAVAMNGELSPGKIISCEFKLLPYSTDDGAKKIAASGDYILKLWYNRGNEGPIEAEFPVALVKRFGKMYLKSQV